MPRIVRTYRDRALAAIALAYGLAVIAASLATGIGSSDTTGLQLRYLSETQNTITLAWTPPADAAGYLFVADGKQVSRSFNGSKAQVRFSKGPSAYEVRSLAVGATGTWPPAPPPVTETTPTVPVPTVPTTTTTTTVPTVPSPVSFAAPAWTVREETNQTDPGSGSGNRYTFGWIKSRRPSPTQSRWNNESVVEFADYPDEFVMIESKRFDLGYPGRTTNFHLVGDEQVGETQHSGVSPLSADYRPGASSDWPKDGSVRPGLVLTDEAELDDHRRGHWQILTDAEITADRTATWTLVWRIHWSMSRDGYAKVMVLKNGMLVREVSTGAVKTAYAGQRPRLYVWLGGYESAGLSSPARMTQTLDYRGRTIAEALADRPTLGSIETSRGTGSAPSSSVSAGASLIRPDSAIPG